MSISKPDISIPNFWNEKYITGEHGWDLNGPTPIFQNWAKSIENKSEIKICIPGCGYGHDLVYLKQAGFDVYGFDFSSEAVHYIQNKNKNIKIYCLDFFNLDKSFYNYFDYILEYTFYCAINPSYRMKYVNKCHDLLKTKGKIVAIMLPFDKKRPKDEGPPYSVDKEEIKNNFSSKFNLIEMKKSVHSIKPRKDIELYFEYEKK